MERRDFISGIGGAAVVALAGGSARAQAPGGKHAKHGPKVAALPAMTPELKAVVESSRRCLEAGEVCVAHCNALLSAGDASLGECQRTAIDMLALCEAMFRTAARRTADAARIKALARVCADYCRACARACEPHAAHHEECKACLASCQECAKACDAYAAA